MAKLKISVLVPGRLHAFDMAIYFQKLGILNELVTGYPKRYVVPFGFDPKLVKSIYVNELINRTTNFLGLGYPLDFLACEAFDYIASKSIKFDSDVYFIWSSYGLKTIRSIRKKNKQAKIIIVRGSTHIELHESLLRQIAGDDNQKITKKIIDKELKEYELTDYITVPSTFSLKSFLNKGIPKEKLFLNMLGVDLSQFPFQQKEVTGKEIVFGNVGTLSRQKNVAGIIKQIELIYATNKNVKLILAGPIESQTFDKSLLDKPFIDYKGKLPQSELYKVYAEIDVFIINSVQEGMAMVQLQALSSGCPLISTENSGGEDLIQQYKNGIVIPAMDNDALKAAILWFIDHPKEIYEMSKLSREVVEHGFTWDDFGERNVKFSKKILN